MKKHLDIIIMGALFVAMCAGIFAAVNEMHKKNEQHAKNFTYMYCAGKLSTWGVEYEHGNYDDVCAKYDSVYKARQADMEYFKQKYNK